MTPLILVSLLGLSPGADLTTTVASRGGELTERPAPAGGYTWADAKTYCLGLSLGGLSGWRLPTLIELESILDYGKWNPSIDTVAFPAPSSSSFWSSSRCANDSTCAWVASFYFGNTSYQGSPITGSNPVRCVR